MSDSGTIDDPEREPSPDKKVSQRREKRKKHGCHLRKKEKVGDGGGDHLYIQSGRSIGLG